MKPARLLALSLLITLSAPALAQPAEDAAPAAAEAAAPAAEPVLAPGAEDATARLQGGETVPSSAAMDHGAGVSDPAMTTAAADPHEGAHDHSAAHPVLPEMAWSFDGPFGTYDRAALQRGYQVYRQVCAACHSMKRLYYRNLADLGYSDAQIKTIAAEYTVTDGPNDEGEMFERPARGSDAFKSPFPNDNAAKFVNNGALPPDLSLIVKARAGGPNYIYGLLTGFSDQVPEGIQLFPGQHYNKYMNGNVISMAPPLSDGIVSYADGTPGTVHQYAMDVAQFLTWASEPHMEARKRNGLKIILFLLVFTGVMYACKRKLWSKLH